jgi:CRISPR/Cas system CSM-associated protein Csm3 (group 7 of RAMP superfamily)
MGEEKKKLEQVQKLNDQLETLTKGKSVSEGLRNVALANEKITANDLKWYSDIREELKDFQIPVDDQLLCKYHQ